MEHICMGMESRAVVVPPQAVKIVVAARPPDFRKGHDGLAAVEQNELGPDGRRKYYVSLRGRKGSGFKSDFGPNPHAPEFYMAYSRKVKDALPKQEVTTTADVVADFYTSTKFKKKKDRTKAGYKRWLDRFVKEFGEDLIKMCEIKESRHEIEKWRRRWEHSPKRYD